jgi:predicted nucleic acid-binding protein
MIALDTSALLRYLTDDVPDLARSVAEVIDGDEPVAISSLVLLETAYALRSRAYERENPEIADALIDLLSHEHITLTDMPADLAAGAIAGVRHVSARHIADALIAAAARHGGAARLLTNDRRFASKLVPVTQLSGSTGQTAPESLR